jgi:hypothetical protein
MKRNQIDRKYLQATLILPVLGLLLVTGCSSIQGTSENQKLTNHRVATYTAEGQEQAQPADPDPDPTYEWFY